MVYAFVSRMLSLKTFSFVFLSFFTVDFCEATFRFEKDPLQKAEEESATAYKTRLKVHALLEGISVKAAEEKKYLKSKLKYCKKD
jgi:hypothetical protein